MKEGTRKYTPMTPMLVHRIRSLRTDGLQLKEIARVTGASTTAVHSYLTGAYKDRYKELTPEQGAYVELTGEMQQCLSDIYKYTDLTASQAVAQALWRMMDQLTKDQLTKDNTDIVTEYAKYANAAVVPDYAKYANAFKYVVNHKPDETIAFAPGDFVEVPQPEKEKRDWWGKRIIRWIMTPQGY